ncbi:MAG: cold shock domain-containing protein [Cytophagaceae bacterium]|nr:cold shock domain-containing protein [Cytophagaceae bacterium]
MGRSTETFSKKEKEKARQKKKRDKEEKREERKANPTTGQTLDEMMAYVDENGNLTTTPPDPRKKRVIKLEEVQIGVSKQEALPPEEAIRKGVVTFFNESKGYGFIRDLQTQDSIFVHASGLVDQVTEQDKVTFEIAMTPKGPNAVDVKKAE